jgi:uncharacterized protein with HEPN domain
MPKKPDLALFHVLEMARRVETFCVGKSFRDYRNDLLLRLAVERCIEIISEASRSIPEEFKAEHPDIPWKDIAGIGNVMRHDYDNVRDDIIWDIVEKHLDALREAVEQMARDHNIDLERKRFRD